MLDRIPELEVLAHHPRVARALASGKPQRLYRVLWWGRMLGWFKDHRDLVDSLLSQRRLFLEPIKSAPSMFSLNGVGTRIYGHEDPDPHDGTGIGTLFFTLLFVPIIPLRQYLVTSEGRNYSFFGTVPFGTVTFVWRQLMLAGIAVAIVVAAVTGFDKSRHNDLVVINGLEMDVTAVIDGNPLEIPPLDRQTRRLKTGFHQIAVKTQEGKVLEEGTLEIRSGDDVVAWNVIGAAPLYEERIPYSMAPSESSDQPDPTVFCGQSSIVRPAVNFVFRDPPDSIDLSSNQSVAWRNHFDLAEGGWQLCVGYLMQEQPEEAEWVACQAADFDSAEDIGVVVVVMISAGHREELLQWLDDALTTNDGVELHRARQNELRWGGRTAEMRTEYLARYEASQDSADAAYLWARTLPDEETLEELPSLRERWPEHYYLRLSQAWVLHRNYRFSESLPLWKQLESDHKTDEEQIEALVGLGRVEEAVSIAESSAIDSFDTAVLRAKVAVAAGKGPNLATVSELGMDPAFAQAMLLARVSGDVSGEQLEAITDPAQRSAVEIAATLHSDGARAIELFRSAGANSLQNLDLDSRLLLLGEAVRIADADLETLLAENLPLYSYLGYARNLILGQGNPEDFENLPIHMRAVVTFATSRRPGISRAEVASLRRAARRDDVLNTVVSHAIDHWSS
jgi:hypothetical protein